MSQECLVPAPELSPPDSQSLAPSQIVPMLIGSTVEAIERELVLQTLARCDGNRTHAARMLGFSVRTLRNKIRQYAADGRDVPAHIQRQLSAKCRQFPRQVLAGLPIMRLGKASIGKDERPGGELAEHPCAPHT